MSRRRRPTNPVSLFPFLAVLVSTMGALILLLLVIARQAQLRPAQVAETPSSLAPLPPLPGLKEYAPLSPLPTFVPPQVQHRPMPSLPELEDPRSALLAKIKDLRRQIDEIHKRRADESPAPDERLLVLNQSLDELKARLAELARLRQERANMIEDLNTKLTKTQWQKRRAKQSTGASKYAIVPYVGPNGTKRRPIFLECRGNGIFLQPAEVPALTEADVFPLPETESPLVALIRAMVEHYHKDDSQGVPYPLLLVRPDGIEAYYAGREALAGSEISFGYELIEEDMQIDYPDTDPETVTIAWAAVQRSRKQRAETLVKMKLVRVPPELLARQPGESRPRPEGRGTGGADEDSESAGSAVGSDLSRITADFHAGPAARGRMLSRLGGAASEGNELPPPQPLQPSTPARWPGQGAMDSGPGGASEEPLADRETGSGNGDTETPFVGGNSETDTGATTAGTPADSARPSPSAGTSENGNPFPAIAPANKSAGGTPRKTPELLSDLADWTRPPKRPPATDAQESDLDLFMPERESTPGFGEAGIPGLEVTRRIRKHEVCIECRSDGLVLYPQKTTVAVWGGRPGACGRSRDLPACSPAACHLGFARTAASLGTDACVLPAT